MNINIIMGFKTITIKDSVYRKLVKAKGKEESFSAFFDRIVKKKPDLWKYYGAWNLAKGEKERIMTRIEERRKLLDAEWKERVGSHENH